MAIDKDDFTEMLIRRNENDIERARLQRRVLYKEVFNLSRHIREMQDQIRQLKGEDEIDGLL